MDWKWLASGYSQSLGQQTCDIVLVLQQLQMNCTVHLHTETSFAKPSTVQKRAKRTAGAQPNPATCHSIAGSQIQHNCAPGKPTTTTTNYRQHQPPFNWSCAQQGPHHPRGQQEEGTKDSNKTQDSIPSTSCSQSKA